MKEQMNNIIQSVLQNAHLLLTHIYSTEHKMAKDYTKIHF
jgi:hypothetical protein